MIVMGANHPLEIDECKACLAPVMFPMEIIL
jgi:hypothetical protein